MYIKFTAPENLAEFRVSDLITFAGEAANIIVKVRLKADGYIFGEAPVSYGHWNMRYLFNTDGKRYITVHGFDSNNQEVASDNLEIILIKD